MKSVLPRSLFAWLALFLGALSMLALMQAGFNYSFGFTFTVMLDFYENLIRMLIGSWAEPIVKAWLAALRPYFGDLTLYSHWKHIFVLMSIYFVRDAQTSEREGLLTAAFILISGLFVATVSSVAAGTVPTSAADMTSNFAIAAIPIMGMFVYDLMFMAWAATFLRKQQAQEYHETTPTWWGDMAAGMPWLIGRTFGGFALLWFGLQTPIVQHSQSPGLLMLAVLVFALGLYWLAEAALGTSQLRNHGESWSEAYWRNGITKLGVSILVTFLSTGLFVAANAGLGFYRL